MELGVLKGEVAVAVDDSDVARVKKFYDKHKDREFVAERRRMNIERNLP